MGWRAACVGTGVCAGPALVGIIALTETGVLSPMTPLRFVPLAGWLAASGAAFVAAKRSGRSSLLWALGALVTIGGATLLLGLFGGRRIPVAITVVGVCAMIAAVFGVVTWADIAGLERRVEDGLRAALLADSVVATNLCGTPAAGLRVEPGGVSELVVDRGAEGRGSATARVVGEPMHATSAPEACSGTVAFRYRAYNTAETVRYRSTRTGETWDSQRLTGSGLDILDLRAVNEPAGR